MSISNLFRTGSFWALIGVCLVFPGVLLFLPGDSDNSEITPDPPDTGADENQEPANRSRSSQKEPEEHQRDGDTTRVKGTIVNLHTRSGVSGAHIMLSREGTRIASTSSDEAGDFVMNNVSEPPYVLRISRSSYVQMSREVESGDAGEIPLLPHARLTGKIVDGQDHPISGANVHLRLSGERTNRINTGLKSQERLIQSYEKRGVLNQNPKVSADQKPVIKAYRSALEHKGSFRVDPESTRTGEDGTFTFTGLLPDHQIDLRRIPPVTYELRIEPPSNHPAIRKSLSLSPGSNTLHLESLEQAAVKGQIQWLDGTPVQGEAEMWFDTETDKKRFGVREGPLKQKSPGRNWTGNRFSSR